MFCVLLLWACLRWGSKGSDLKHQEALVFIQVETDTKHYWKKKRKEGERFCWERTERYWEEHLNFLILVFWVSVLEMLMCVAIIKKSDKLKLVFCISLHSPWDISCLQVMAIYCKMRVSEWVRQNQLFSLPPFLIAINFALIFERDITCLFSRFQ